jgi:hypothetical protein
MIPASAADRVAPEVVDDEAHDRRRPEARIVLAGSVDDLAPVASPETDAAAALDERSAPNRSR